MNISTQAFQCIIYNKKANCTKMEMSDCVKWCKKTSFCVFFYNMQKTAVAKLSVR